MTLISPASYPASEYQQFALRPPVHTRSSFKKATPQAGEPVHPLGTVQVETIDNVEQWERHKRDWHRLHGNRLNRSYPWLRAWWDAYQKDYRLEILRAHRNGETIAFFPIARRRNWVLGETICLMGSGKACSDDLGILVLKEDIEEAVIAFADCFLGEKTKTEGWDHFDFDGIRKGDPAMEAFFGRLEASNKVRIERRVGPNCWEASIDKGWTPYVKSLSRRVRKMLTQTENLQETIGGFRVAQTLEEANEMAQVIADLHQGRWAERGINGCFGTTSFESFLLKTLASLWDESDSTNRPFVSLVTVNEVPAGGMIGFRYAGTLYVYLTGMNTKFDEFRPGWQTSFCSIREAAAMDCKSVDFMRGDEGYKPRLGALPHAQERWIVCSHRWKSKLRNWAYYRAIDIRDRVRKYREARASNTPSDAEKSWLTESE
jgi:CelD/BcsL family acetyltransferase involved in cellulose biosynthesis